MQIEHSVRRTCICVNGQNSTCPPAKHAALRADADSFLILHLDKWTLPNASRRTTSFSNGGWCSRPAQRKTVRGVVCRVLALSNVGCRPATGHVAGSQVSLGTRKRPRIFVRLQVVWLRGKATRGPPSCRHSAVRSNPLESRSRRADHRISYGLWIGCQNVSVQLWLYAALTQSTLVSRAECRPGNVNCCIAVQHKSGVTQLRTCLSPTQRQRTKSRHLKHAVIEKSLRAKEKEAACTHRPAGSRESSQRIPVLLKCDPPSVESVPADAAAA